MSTSTPGSTPPTPPSYVDFSTALLALQEGKLIQRAGWVAEQTFLTYVQNNILVTSSSPLNQRYSVGTVIDVEAYIGQHVLATDGTPIILHYMLTQQDVLANDWVVMDAGSPPVS